MKKVRLGKTGLVVSRVGMGGIPIQRLREAEAIRVLRRCLDLGVTFLDTAHSYTTSEERIGTVVAGCRERLTLGTKTSARDRTTVEEHLESSLRRLGTHTIDLWQLHNVSSLEAYQRVLGPGGAMQAAQAALCAGKIKHIGITSHSMDVTLEAVGSGLFETIQFPFKFVAREPVDELVPLARERGVGFIAMKPFAGGMLEDARLAIEYLLQFDNVIPDPGIEAVEEIEQIVGIVQGDWKLTPGERREMLRIQTEMDTRFCRRCGCCLPCPAGARVPLMMNLRSFWKRYPPSMFTTGGFARALETGESCTQCGICEEKCPYGLPIREYS